MSDIFGHMNVNDDEYEDSLKEQGDLTGAPPMTEQRDRVSQIVYTCSRGCCYPQPFKYECSMGGEVTAHNIDAMRRVVEAANPFAEIARENLADGGFPTEEEAALLDALAALEASHE